MAVTRINNNQISDASAGNVYVGINAAVKLQNYSVTSTKIANNLVYGSDLTVAGNLTVQGNTTTIDTTYTTIEDPILLLASNQTGSPTVDIGFVGQRGTSQNIAFVWDESAGEFVTVYTTTGESNTTVTISSYADLHTGNANIGGNIVVNGTTSLVGSVIGNVSLAGNVTVGNVLTNGQVSAAGNVTGGNINTAGVASVGGNVVGGNVYTTGIVSAVGTVTGGYLYSSGAVSAAGNVVGGNVLSSGIVSSTGNITSAANIAGGNVLATTLVSGTSVTGTTFSASANITGGNVLTSGQVSSTGNITSAANVSGGNLLTGGQVSSTGNITSAANISAGNISTSGTFSATSLSASGNITGGNLISNGLITATGNINSSANIAGGNLLATTTVSAASFLGSTVSVSANITGGNVLTGGLISSTGNITSASNITGGNLLTSGSISATGNISTAGNIIAGNVLSVSNVNAVGGYFTGNLTVLGNLNASIGIVYANSGIFYGNAITGDNAIFAGIPNFTPLGSNVVAQFAGNANSYSQINFQNINSGTSASTDFIATADNGDDDNYYIDVGINSSNFNDPVDYPGFFANDSYVHNHGGNLILNPETTGKAIRFMVGGTDSTNVVGNVTASGLDITGTISATANITSAANVSGGNVIATAIVSGASVLGSIVSASANITGGNILTGGQVSSTGNITSAANVQGANLVATTAVVTPTVIGTTVTVSSTGGLITLKPSTNVSVSSTYINNLADPVQNQDAATKAYVDNLVTTQVAYHDPVYAATVGTLEVATGGTITYTQPNGVGNGVGATLTVAGGSFNLIDTANIQTAGTRVLVKNQANAVLNGVYSWTNATTLTRTTDADTYGPNSSTDLSINDYFFVQSGNVNAGSAWIVNGPTGTITFGTSNITFAQFSSSQTYTANTQAGILITGTVISAKVDNNTTAFDVGGNIIVKAGANLTTPNIGAATGTSLSVTGNLNAGSGVSATGNVAGGNLLTGGVVSSTGNVTSAANISGGNVLTGGVVSSTGNITSSANISGGNLLATTTVSAVSLLGSTVSVSGNVTGGAASIGGNITGGNILTSGIVSSTGNITSSANIAGGNLIATSNVVTAGVSASGNITGGNVLTGGLISSTGNITSAANINGANVVATTIVTAPSVLGTIVSASANITGGNLITGGVISATGNISTAGNVTASYYLGNGSQLTGINATTSGFPVSAGTSNINAVNGGNIFVTIGGTPNVAVFATDGEYVNGLISVTGNVRAGNVVVPGGNIDVTNFINTGALLATGRVEAGTTMSAAGNITGANIITGGLITATGNITSTANVAGGNVISTALVQGVTVSASGNVIGGNVTTAGQVSATGNITSAANVAGGNVLATAVVSGASLLGSLASISGNITGANLNTGGANGLTLNASTINSNASRITVNSNSSAVDFAVNGTLANVFYVNGTTNTASFGSSTQTTNALVAFNATNSILFPVGNTAQRPGTGVTGMIRFNSTLNAVEIYDNSQWSTVGTPSFTVISDQQFSGDGSTVVFTLTGSPTTTAATIVSINGVVQIPTIAYAISGAGGNILTFTEAPQTGDQIDVRVLTTTTSITSISNSPGSAVVAVDPTLGEVDITGNLVPVANVTYSLGTSSLRWKDLYVGGNSIYLGNTVIKNVAGGNTIGFYGPDGVTPATIASSSIDTTTISNGTSNVAVASSGGNIRINVGGTSNVAVFDPTGVSITGNLTVTGNATLTGNILGDRVQNGTTSFDIQTAGGNANLTIGSTSNVVVWSTAGQFVTGLISASGNITSAANISGGNLIITGSIVDAGDAVITSSATNANVTLTPTGTGTIIVNKDITNGQANGTGNIGSATGYFNTVFAKATSAQYADLAEIYAADAEYEPGTVLSFGGEQEVTLSTVASDARIAGVVSTNPSYVMNATLDAEFTAAVALTGRVPTKVTGPVAKGDMMVAGGNGRAVACATPAMGTVIGKALENHPGGDGVIEVVVGRL